MQEPADGSLLGSQVEGADPGDGGEHHGSSLRCRVLGGEGILAEASQSGNILLKHLSFLFTRKYGPLRCPTSSSCKEKKHPLKTLTRQQ